MAVVVVVVGHRGWRIDETALVISRYSQFDTLTDTTHTLSLLSRSDINVK